jgi:ring-1,2-phenylacetyl-CoA epoxidase subunit PaaE
VDTIETLTDDSIVLSLEVPAHLSEVFRFEPGQHVALARHIDGDGTRRSYSICSPAGGPLRVAVKRLPNGSFSNWVHDELRPGDVLDVLPPAGRFTLKANVDRNGRYVAIAAGSGITPIISIISSVLSAESLSTFSLMYGNRTTSSVMFLETLQDLKDRYIDRLQIINVLSREQQDVPLAHGHIDADKVERLLELVAPATGIEGWFLCGPLGLTEVAGATLRNAGIEDRRIHRELFYAEDAGRPLAVQQTSDRAIEGASVSIVLDGRRTTFTMPPDGRSVLEAALTVRSDAPFACKGGVCGTCRCRVLKGKVWMEHPYALEVEEIAAGVVLACQARPLTEELVLDFDAF